VGMIRFVAIVMLVLGLAASTAAQGASPGKDGRILYVGLIAGRSQIFSASLTGANVRQLTHFTDSDAADPSWSADGKRIAFARDFELGKPTEHLDIYTMNADGSDQHGMGFKGLNGGPVWFPDGRRILYSRVDGLWVVPAAGGAPH